MALNTPVDREFKTVPAGFVRDRVVLANFREGLRALTNPETGQPFTADEIQRATQPGSRWYVAAQAIDDYGQGEQRKALWLADQIRIDRASTRWLEGYHGSLWGEKKLGATGGAGDVRVTGVPGTFVVGSTTLDGSGYQARDPEGNVYQVLLTEAVEPGGSVVVAMQAVTPGAATNPQAGKVLTWITRDPNMDVKAVVEADFSGGTDVETDADYASRMAGNVRHRPGGGNDAHVRAWSRAASNAIEDGFVYACAFHSGSALVAITQKRGNALGPLARKPNVSVLATAIAYLTPPLSPVFRTGAFVVVTGWQEQYSDVVLRLGMAKGTAAGFLDARPFPKFHATTPQVVSKVDNTDFNILCPGDATLPGQLSGATLSGANAPKLMLWDKVRSRFVTLSVSSVQDLTGSLYRVLLSAQPENGVQVGQRVSPGLQGGRHLIVAKTIENYFDELGPADLFDLETDERGGRCVRFPRIGEEKPYRAGAVVATRVIEALGGSAADGTLASMSLTQPTYPANLMLGPNMLVCGHVGLYEI